MSIIATISAWIILLPLVVGVVWWNKLDKDGRLVLMVIIAGTTPSLLRPFLNYTSILNFFYNFYTPIEFLLYYILFRSKIVRPFLRRFLLWSLMVFMIVVTFSGLKFGITNRFLNEWVLASNIIQLTWIYLILLQYYNADEVIIFKFVPFYWYIIGIAAYASCTVVYFSLFTLINKDSSGHFQVIKVIHHSFNIILYMMFLLGFLQNAKDKSLTAINVNA